MKTKAAASAGTNTERRAPRGSERDGLEARFPHRDILLFPDRLIPPFETDFIDVYPEVESHVQRVVMHRSIAARLTLLQILVGDQPRTRVGAGSCEIFLSDVPNWAPSGMIITPEAPLRLYVRNMLGDGLKISGTVIVGVAELPKIEPRPARRGLFGFGGSGG